jgi:hypothetical protein
LLGLAEVERRQIDLRPAIKVMGVATRLVKTRDEPATTGSRPTTKTIWD